jgi:hypothetical protein
MIRPKQGFLSLMWSRPRSVSAVWALLGCCSLSLFLSGCETPQQSALAGAGAGALVGGALKGTNRGMVQGAAIGAIGGYAVGAYGQEERRRGYVEGSNGYPSQAPEPAYYEPPPPPTPRYRYHHHAPPPSEVLLYGRPSGRYGFVYSPYGSRCIVEVRGIAHGARVWDPVACRYFLNP